MSNFIDRFEAQLVATAPRPLPIHRRAWRWVAQHAVISIAIVGVATASSAAAAITVLRGTPSAPLNAALRVKGAGGEFVAAGRYAIRVGPLPQPGAVGWCEMVFLLSDKRKDREAGGGCRAGVTRVAHIGVGTFNGSPSASMAFFMVDDRVAGMRLRNGHVVLARTDPSLPTGWKAVVVFSGDPGVGTFTDRALDHWKLLGADGAVIGSGGETDSDIAQRRTSIPVQPHREGAGEIPAGAPCRIERTDARPWPKSPLYALSLRGAPKPVTDVAGRPLLGCSTLLIGARAAAAWQPLRVSVFVDAKDPGARPARFPGMTGPDDGRITQTTGGISFPLDPNHLDEPTGLIQRRGNAWVMVDGGTASERSALFGRIRVTNLPG